MDNGQFLLMDQKFKDYEARIAELEAWQREALPFLQIEAARCERNEWRFGMSRRETLEKLINQAKEPSDEVS